MTPSSGSVFWTAVAAIVRFFISWSSEPIAVDISGFCGESASSFHRSSHPYSHMLGFAESPILSMWGRKVILPLWSCRFLVNDGEMNGINAWHLGGTIHLGMESSDNPGIICTIYIYTSLNHDQNVLCPNRLLLGRALEMITSLVKWIWQQFRYQREWNALQYSITIWQTLGYLKNTSGAQHIYIRG